MYRVVDYPTPSTDGHRDVNQFAVKQQEQKEQRLVAAAASTVIEFDSVGGII